MCKIHLGLKSNDRQLKRENLDLKEQNFTPEAMQEFIRDTIANINGIYYVVSIEPDLLSGLEKR